MTSRNIKPYSARPDHSVLRPCIEVANSGMKQAIYAMKCGSKEVVDVLLNECNVIYECKVCFNMFRSLANLISHKRSFCKNRSNSVLHVFNNGDDSSQSEDSTPEKMVVVRPEPVETVFPDKDLEVKDYTPSIELLKEAGILADIEERPVVDSLLPQKHSQSKLKEIVKKLRTIQETRAPENTQQNLFLEPLRQTDHAVFQTCFFNVNDKTTMSQRYVDLIKARQLTAAFVGPDNKVIEPTDSSRSYSPASSEYSFHTYQGDKHSFDTYKPPKPTSFDYPCLKCNYSNARLYRVIHHMKQNHDLKDHHNITKVRSKIREKAIRKSKNYSNIMIEDDMNPWVLVKKITDEEIAQHLQAAEEARKKATLEKMALASALLADDDKKLEQVSLPKLPPSIGETEVNIDDDNDYKETIFNQSNNKVPNVKGDQPEEDDKKSDDEDDESNSNNGIFNNEETPIKIKISLTNFSKKRSRSSSPASSSGSSDQSSKTENLETKRSRQNHHQSSSSVSPNNLSNNSKRDILSTRFENSNSTTETIELKEPNGNTTEDVEMSKNLQEKLSPIDEEHSNSGRRSRRRVSPASKHK